MGAAELLLAVGAVALQGCNDSGQVAALRRDAGRTPPPQARTEVGEVGVGDPSGAGRRVAVAEVHELGHVVGASCLYSRAKGGLAHAAEGLAQHEGPGGPAVDVEVPAATRSHQYACSRSSRLSSAAVRP